MIKHIIIHCSATYESMDIDANTIDRWHKNKGWSGIGYNYVIKRDGTIQEGREVGKVGAHTLGRNHDSIGICWIGGLGQDGKSEDNRTQEQKISLFALLKHLKSKHIGVKISGHSDWNATSCPAFNVKEWLKELEL